MLGLCYNTVRKFNKIDNNYMTVDKMESKCSNCGEYFETAKRIRSHKDIYKDSMGFERMVKQIEKEQKQIMKEVW